MEKLYNQLIVAYSAAYPDKTGKMVQLNVANIWKEMKAKNDKEQLHSVVKQQIQEWTRKSMQKKATFLGMWSKVCNFIFKFNIKIIYLK